MELNQLQEWWKGSAFLSDSQDLQPHLGVIPLTTGDQTESKRNVKRECPTGTKSLITFATVLNIGNDCWRLQPEKLSSWTILTRVTAWTFRLIDNCKQDDKVMQGSEEVMDAENYLSQQKIFKEEYTALMK